MQPVRLTASRACATLALAFAGMTASCSFDPPSLSVGDGTDGGVDPMNDASGPRPDADPDAPDAGRVTAPDGGMTDAMEGPDARPPCQSWPTPRHFDPCAIPQPSGELVLDESGEYTYDTNTGTLRAPDGDTIDHAQTILASNPPGNPDVRLVSVDGFVVGPAARLRATGGMPLLVASWSEIVVDGLIDASSSPTGPGAGANTGNCNDAGQGGQNNSGGGGGGGGGLNGDGGAGGQGENGGAAGTAGDKVGLPTTVRGGCAGARGGRGDQTDGAGGGGDGGGALQLSAWTRITINGRLHAGGAGGGGATNSPRRCGGGGGGSGGLIDLDAPTLSIGASAILSANGGGGGEGADNEGGDPGTSGVIGNGPAAGGNGGDSVGGNGGTGGALADRDGGDGVRGSQSGPLRGGGGGGGGGAGYIIFDGTASVMPGATISPAQSTR